MFTRHTNSRFVCTQTRVKHGRRPGMGMGMGMQPCRPGLQPTPRNPAHPDPTSTHPNHTARTRIRVAAELDQRRIGGQHPLLELCNVQDDVITVEQGAGRSMRLQMRAQVANALALHRLIFVMREEKMQSPAKDISWAGKATFVLKALRHGNCSGGSDTHTREDAVVLKPQNPRTVARVLGSLAA